MDHGLRAILTILIIVAGVVPALAQGTDAVITYRSASNGKPVPGELRLYIKGSRARLQPAANRGAAQKEQQYLELEEKATYQVLTTDDGRKYTLRKPFGEYAKPELLPDTATILGYPCKKAKVFIRSNTIEVWYTNALPVKGTPALTIAPGLGLVLKTVRNGNYETVATGISMRNVGGQELNWPAQQGQLVDDAAYMQQVIESRYTTLPVFTQEQVYYGDVPPAPAMLATGVTYHFAGGTIILKKIKLPEATEGRQLFAVLTQYSNGDAYDRTGSVFMIPANRELSFLDGLQKGVKALPLYAGKYQGVTATDNYLPPLELMRFFTPFGVRHFNEQVKIRGYQWADSAVYRQDITELLPCLQGEVLLGVFIGNYDKGGHKVSLRLQYYAGDESERQPAGRPWVMPLFNTTNLMEMAGQEYGTMFGKDSLTVTVDVPAGVKQLRLRYITTGHGGWGGGDEFNQRLNEIFVDGERVYHFIPWRTDCGTYRLLNPASGNFGNGLSSSDLSRSNWCPGTLTVPVSIPLPKLAPGRHTLQVAIPLGPREGGSFSAWNVSGCLIGDRE